MNDVDFDSLSVQCTRSGRKNVVHYKQSATLLARQSVNVNQREKDLNIFYFTFLHNLHVNQGGKLTLQTD